MKRVIVDQIETPADALRRQIGEAEIIVTDLKGAGDKALRLLRLLDEIDQQISTLSQGGIDLRSERGRLDTILATLSKKKRVLVGELRGLGGLPELRAERNPSPDQWWWYLEREIRREQRHALKRYGIMTAVALTVLVLVTVVYQTFFRPDPVVVALNDNYSTAMNHIMMGEIEEAIPYIERNAALAPDEPEWLIRLGVLEQLAGDARQAEQHFEQARELLPDETQFLLARGQYYSELEAHDAAVRDLEQVVQMDPSSAMGYLLLGRSYAGLGRRQEALDAYEKASEAAGKGQETVYVMARVEMAQLLQSPPMPSVPSTETPVP